MSLARSERMLFNYGTTNRTDFRDGEISPEVKTEYKEKWKCAMPRPAPVKYTHTMMDWTKGVLPPFDLLLKPKEIVRTDPWECQQVYEKPPDVERAEVQRTRPRLVMTPAFSLDDVKDEQIRDILIGHTYTSTLMQANQDIERHYLSVRAPFGTHPAPANVMKLSGGQLPYVHPVWRREMLAWENNQLRTHADTDANFWLRQKTTCKECERTAEREKQKKFTT